MTISSFLVLSNQRNDGICHASNSHLASDPRSSMVLDTALTCPTPAHNITHTHKGVSTECVNLYQPERFVRNLRRASCYVHTVTLDMSQFILHCQGLKNHNIVVFTFARDSRDYNPERFSSIEVICQLAL